MFESFWKAASFGRGTEVTVPDIESYSKVSNLEKGLEMLTSD